MVMLAVFAHLLHGVRNFENVFFSKSTKHLKFSLRKKNAAILFLTKRERERLFETFQVETKSNVLPYQSRTMLTHSSHLDCKFRWGTCSEWHNFLHSCLF